MSFAAKLPGFQRSLSQAFHFADTDNTLDGLARVRRLQRELDELLESPADAAEAASIARFKAQVERALVRLQKRHEAWQQTVQARAAAYDAAEQQAYQSPLPVKGIG